MTSPKKYLGNPRGWKRAQNYIQIVFLLNVTFINWKEIQIQSVNPSITVILIPYTTPVYILKVINHSCKVAFATLTCVVKKYINIFPSYNKTNTSIKTNNLCCVIIYLVFSRLHFWRNNASDISCTRLRTYSNMMLFLFLPP